MTPPTTTSSYALVLGSIGLTSPSGAIPLQAYQKYYNNGPFIYRMARHPGDVKDGLSFTMFVGETTQNDAPQTMNSWALGVAYLSSLRSTTNPMNSLPDNGGIIPLTIANSGLSVDGETVMGGFASSHSAGSNFAFGDRHVSFLSELVNFPIYQALSTIAGSEPIDPTLFNQASK